MQSSESNDHELPLILGFMPVLAEHAVAADTFEETSFRPTPAKNTIIKVGFV
jgi:hypothetical protein